MENNLVMVLIPVYKSIPREHEMISFHQCLYVLGKYPFYIITHQNLDISYYTDLFLRLGIKFNIEYFPESAFSSLKGYNRLMLSKEFYQHFIHFEYILLYQLDAYVFRDELEYWCNQGYDYVGAPWINIDIYRWLFIDKLFPFELKMFHKITGGKFLKRSGNGGLSLRKTESMIKNLGYFSFRVKTWTANEDIFFSHYVGTFNPFFKMPDLKTALKFSFDVYPVDAYKMNNLQLPFGCHAFYREDHPYYVDNHSFWKKKIEQLQKL